MFRLSVWSAAFALGALLFFACDGPQGASTSTPILSDSTAPEGQPTATAFISPAPESTSTPPPTVETRPEEQTTPTPVIAPAPTTIPSPVAVPTELQTPTPVPTSGPDPTPPPLPTATPEPQDCIPSGNQAAIQNALTDAGSEAVLCQNAVFELSDTVVFTNDDQQIYTQGFPTDDSRAFMKITHKDVVTAVSTNNYSRVKLSNVIIDGSRPEFGIGTGGLIEWGGTGTDQVIEWVKAYEPRGWSVLVIGHGDDLKCSGSVARNNELGPAGRAEYIMADGISLACRNSIVENNTIVDATDGGIVIFQAPGSLVANNTIRAETQILFYGIAMVDTGPYDGDFTGTRVIGNVIDARGALIRHGIDMGPWVGCIPEEETAFRSFGAVVTDNVLKGDHMGYGFAVSGVTDWTVTGNVDLSTHLEAESNAGCFGEAVAPPGGFQFNPALSSGTFQQEFEAVTFDFGGALWPMQTLVSEECAADLIGAEALAEIKAGTKGPLWYALETAANGELIGRCVSVYQPPEVAQSPGYVMMGVEACEPTCADVVLTNLSETEVADMGEAEFILESFSVPCVGLPELIQPGEQARCTIEDYVTPGFQVINWYGFPFIGNQNGWGFDYPFVEE